MKQWLILFTAAASSVASAAVIYACSDYGAEGESTGSKDDDASVLDGGGNDGAQNNLAPDTGGPNPSDASSGDGSLVWTPAELPGLVLWLDGAHVETTANGSSIVRWIDRSGQGNDARPTDAGPRPTLVLAGVGLNKQPAVKFSGIDGDYLEIADNNTGLRFGTGPFLIEVVARHNTPLSGRVWNYGFIYAKQTLSTPYPGAVLNANHAPGNETGMDASSVLQVQVEGQDEGTLLSGEGYLGRPFLLGFQRTTSATPTIDLRIDGIVVASKQTPPADRDLSATGFPARIGGSSNGQNLVGEISEIVIVGSHEATPQELTKLEAYMKTKYGL